MSNVETCKKIAKFDLNTTPGSERGNHTVSIFNKEVTLEKCIDNELIKTVTYSNRVEVIETNVPSSQALKNFSLKLLQIKERLEGRVK